jgi:hypothetical protein
MPTETADADVLDLLLEVEVDEVEYSRIMRRIGVDGDETVTPVSAFNSSI